MASIRIKRPTKVVQHNRLTEVKVTIQEPSRADYLEWRAMLMEYAKPLVNPETKEIVRRANGLPEMAEPNIPASKLHEYLARNIVSVEGIDERNAKTDEIAKAFLERDFDMEVEVDVAQPDGQHVTQKVTKSFAIYLLDQINSDATFRGSDPLASASA